MVKKGQFLTKQERRCQVDSEERVLCWTKNQFNLISKTKSDSLTITTYRTHFATIAFLTFLWEDILAVCG